MAPVRLQTVCVRHTPAELEGDAAAISGHNQRWVRDVNVSGAAFVPVAARWRMDGEGVDRCGVDRTTTLEQLLD